MATRGYVGGKLARDAVGQKIPYLQPRSHESAEYRRVWESVVEDFPPTYFRESDRGTLDNYVRVSLVLQRAHAQLEQQGFLVEGPHGPVENPILKVVDKLTRNALAHARALKITPLSRNDRKQVPKDSEHLKNMLESKEDGPEGLKLAS